MRNLERSLQEEAAFWFARMRSDRANRADHKAFLDWLNADPSHSAAYSECEAAWQEIGSVAGEEDIVQLRREALVLAPRRRSFGGAGAIAAALALVLASGALILNRMPSPQSEVPSLAARGDLPRVFQTAVGERSAVTLPDGSIAELNTNSLAVVDYSNGRRLVRLARGQALFNVASDEARPFVVEAAGQRIVALGTIFDVRVDSETLHVTLIEGQVRVEPASGNAPVSSAAVRTLRPGEKLVARSDEPTVVLPADVERQTDWRTGRIVFSDEPLAEVVSEINRYSTRKVVIADRGLEELRVSGVFRVGSTTSFVAALDAGFPVTAEPRGSDVVLRWEQ